MTTDLIFDFFGTLVAYTPGVFHTASYERTHACLLQQGFALPYEVFEAILTAVSNDLEAKRKRTCREYHMNDLGRAFFQSAFGIQASDAILHPFMAAFMQEWERGIVYLDGVAAMLERLASRYRLSILSNTHSPTLIPDQLARMGMAGYFAQVITSVEVGICKPDPAIFHEALTQLGIIPGQAIYIGDTYGDDFEGATAAGIACVLIDADGRYPDVPHRITSVLELEKYLTDNRDDEIRS